MRFFGILIRNLQKPTHMKIHKISFALSAVFALSFPASATLQSATTPYEQDFVLTAYYSPLPNQCCYVKGSLEADKILNGNGTHGADGTPVYPGMLAGPPSYAFGTRISLPGLGVMTVHDRGGAIQEWSDAHRLDVWAGYGEEGLARALAFGVKRIHGTVYPPGTTTMKEEFALDILPAMIDRLQPFLTADAGVLTLRPKQGETGLSVRMLQEALHQLGYMSEVPTGFYGDATTKSLSVFQSEMGITDSSAMLTETTAAYLAAALEVKRDPPLAFMGKESSASDIMKAQRMLRFLGYYRGRTDGVYADNLFAAITKFQKEHGLIGTNDSPGAGRIGPMTKGKIALLWQRRIVKGRAQSLLAYQKVQQLLADKGHLIAGFFGLGQTGDDVRQLQEFLASQGFFPKDKINGVYGPLTGESVLKYQLQKGIVKNSTQDGAGTIGSRTLRQLRSEQITSALRLVRGYGWNVL